MTDSLAAETRQAVDRHPFLRSGLRAGILNYTAAARYLDVEGEPEAIATALRRYADELPAYETDTTDGRSVTVRMQSGIGVLDGDRREDEDREADRGLLSVGGITFGTCDGTGTAIVATGAVDASALAATLQALSIDDIEPDGAAVGEETMVIVVDRRDGVTALRTVEAALDRVPGE